jgi:hypothetical protein
MGLQAGMKEKGN